MTDNLDVRRISDLEQALSLAQHTVYKHYLSELSQYPLVKPSDALMDETPEKCLRFFQLKEFSCKKGEDIFQKLSTVYYSVMALGSSMIVMIDVDDARSPAKIYLGVHGETDAPIISSDLSVSYANLKNGILGNFPGSSLDDLKPAEISTLMDDITKTTKYISAVSCVASIRDKSKTENKNFIQGMERFVDTMRGQTYTAVFIAEPITAWEQAEIRRGYERMYNNLSAFRKTTWSYSETNSRAVMESLSEGTSEAITKGISDTQSHAKNMGFSIGINAEKSSSHAETYTKTKPTAASRAGNAVATAAGILIPIVASAAIPVVGKIIGGIVGGAVGASGGAAQGSTISEGIIDSIGRSMGISGGFNYGRSKGNSQTESENSTTTTSKTVTRGTTDTTGTGRTIQLENINKSVEEMLSRIDEQLKRIKEGEAYGSYSCAAYFLSAQKDHSVSAATTYRALMIGEGSSVEDGAINIWGKQNNPEAFSVMKEYLRRFVHPVFGIPFSEEGQDLMVYTPGTIVSGFELPLHLGLPTKSVYGMPVLEYAEFGRNITYRNTSEKEEKIPLGNIYHMGKEEKAPVDLVMENLSAHTFITGSTGSGKTNTVCGLLNALGEKKIPFLVVEPAKGEYMDAIGRRPDVTAYSTNPNMQGYELLRINPFRFPSSVVHVLEHMDRLTEIFNVCWPMYAAMPAILKDAMERAYVEAGWDIINSTNRYDSRIFPSFADVLAQIRAVLRESEYSADNKSDYTGALVTRVRSLTTGLNGLILTNNDIPDDELFDRNVIIDLSRIGSVETKSLFMGLIVLKLREYRMVHKEFNSALSHVTVLEEAHNLLKRTSTEQTGEGANLLGKSVEMVANSIAEMRTYGEGFIIADQSPGLLDMSSIRNTNTKIILRLPDYSDRELVGKAAGLNEDQIVELGRLERGVAAVMQNNWMEPVLCKIKKFETKPAGYGGELLLKREMKSGGADETSLKKLILDVVLKKEFFGIADNFRFSSIREQLICSSVRTKIKCEFLEYLQSEEEIRTEKFKELLFDLLDAEKILPSPFEFCRIEEWIDRLKSTLEDVLPEYDSDIVKGIIPYLLDEQVRRNMEYRDLYLRFTEFYQSREGMI